MGLFDRVLDNRLKQIGTKRGKLTLIAIVRSLSGGETLYECNCDCGKTGIKKWLSHIRKMYPVASCGCSTVRRSRLNGISMPNHPHHRFYRFHYLADKVDGFNLNDFMGRIRELVPNLDEIDAKRVRVLLINKSQLLSATNMLVHILPASSPKGNNSLPVENNIVDKKSVDSQNNKNSTPLEDTTVFTDCYGGP